jgi:mRNA interferase MazF
VLVVSSDPFNRSRIQTVIAVALTASVRLAEMPGNVRLTPADSGLERESIANVTQVITLDKSQLTEQAGRISERIMDRVDAGLRRALDL